MLQNVSQSQGLTQVVWAPCLASSIRYFALNLNTSALVALILFSAESCLEHGPDDIMGRRKHVCKVTKFEARYKASTVLSENSLGSSTLILFLHQTKLYQLTVELTLLRTTFVPTRAPPEAAKSL